MGGTGAAVLKILRNANAPVSLLRQLELMIGNRPVAVNREAEEEWGR
jgi:hypothetical protein